MVVNKMLRIYGGQVLIGDSLVDAAIDIDDGCLAAVGTEAGPGRCLDARGLVVLPGIVDIHGDAFERQLMPRPGVDFAAPIGLKDSDRQAVANGITTVYHGVTASWEPGLRSIDNARAILESLERLRPKLAADTRLHLRFEAYNLDAEAEVVDWLLARRVTMLSFNDHLPGGDGPPRPRKVAEMAERAGMQADDFTAMIERLRARTDAVPATTTRLAAVARDKGIPMLSHDDRSPEQRRSFRTLGCRVAEFPMTIATAEEASAAGDDVVLGAPNVVRGGSHVGWINAADMISRGLCTILASDYYYPAPLLAGFRLVADGIVPLTRAWTYVAEQPARAAALADRGRLEPGCRADVILVDATDLHHPTVIATIAAGQLVHLTEAGRLH
jgi:alpha-D-ribose 1-methylphosphonate 5-triphosphate diphosphatase